MQITLFKSCPECNSRSISFINNKKFYCNDCSFTYFHNAVAAVAVIIKCNSKILLTKRNLEPAKGRLDLPGGFVNPGETLEQAAKREVKEELKLELDKIEYFGSYNNIYQYKHITYNSTDAVFITKIENINIQEFNHEISKLLLLNCSEIDLNLIGFESMRNAVSDYISLGKQ